MEEEKSSEKRSKNSSETKYKGVNAHTSFSRSDIQTILSEDKTSRVSKGTKTSSASEIEKVRLNLQKMIIEKEAKLLEIKELDLKIKLVNLESKTVASSKKSKSIVSSETSESVIFQPQRIAKWVESLPNQFSEPKEENNNCLMKIINFGAGTSKNHDISEKPFYKKHESDVHVLNKYVLRQNVPKDFS